MIVIALLVISFRRQPTDDEQKSSYIRYPIAALFLVVGVWALLVRGSAWPFEIEDLNLPQHTALITENALEDALGEEIYDDQKIQDLSRRLIVLDPLSPLPFEALLALELAQETVDPERARVLADATLARDARSLTARLFLFDQAIIDRDWEYAFDAFGKVTQLWPSEARDVQAIFYESLNDETWTDIFLARLKRGDRWTKSFVQSMPIGLINLELMAEMHRPFEDLHERFVARSLREFGLEDAHMIWKQLRPDEAVTHQYGLIDPTFSGSGAIQPFNWSIDPVFAEIDPRRPGLHIVFRGSKRSGIASQITFFAPGKYQFSIRKSAPINNSASDFVWNISCVPTGEELLEVSVFDFALENAPQSIAFEIPEDCGYQELALFGYPGLYGRRFRLTIDEILIKKVAE